MAIAQQTTPSKSGTRRANALPAACMLDEYRIDSILGAGGFGVTYKALDTHLETWVAIKEYFPVEWSFRDADGVTVYPNTQGEASGAEEQLSDYLWGLERFLDEARVLARIQHPYIVRIKRYFRAHGTAYIVMDYEEGQPLNAILRDGETLDEDAVRRLLEDVLPALAAVHAQGYLHRDIKPSNLYVRASDHRVMLIDFGSAREAVSRHSKSVTSLVTPGYSPPEQYTTRTDRYGTWTDIYALGAVLYRCISGHTPPEAAERLLDDTLEPAIKVGTGRYSIYLLEVIDRALAVRPEQRFLTVADMQAALVGPQSENNNRTVIMPLAKRVKLAKESGKLRITQPPAIPLDASIEDDQGDRLNMTQLPTVTTPHSADPQPSEVPPALPPGSAASNWRLPAILAGGVALMAAAVVIIWLGSPQPTPTPEPVLEQKPPPRYSLGHGELTPSPTPAETPAMAPPAPAVATPDAAPPAMTPAAATPAPPPETVGESPAPTTRETASSPAPAEPLTLPVTDSGQELTDTTVEQAVTPVTPPKTPSREATPKRTRTTRQRPPRKSREQPVVAAPAQPVQAQPAPAPKRSELWDAPTDTGFNQK
ncbi:MAG: Non-specific serine/threonine protein kinase [Pseudomonadota bacterium]|nr:Non-specific serine/threonine protein kinase [Pseudomonadota bacterium]